MESERDQWLRGYYSAALPSLEANDIYFTKTFCHQKGDSSSSRLHICLICLERGTTVRLSDSCDNTYGISSFGDSVIVRGVCLSCIDLYLVSSINSASIDIKGAIRCHCPDRKCSFRYDREFIYSRVTSEDTRRKYEHFVQNAMVEADQTLRWCPRLGCENIVSITSDRQKRIQCSRCLGSFCLRCGNEHSSWTPCSLVSECTPVSPPLTSSRELKMISCNGKAPPLSMVVASVPLVECILRKMAGVATSRVPIATMSSVGTAKRGGPTTPAPRVIFAVG
jgi:hypothetical protein